MQELFGIPMGPLATVLASHSRSSSLPSARSHCATASSSSSACERDAAGAARTALIVTGLMLGTTIIASALATGDTMSHTIRISAIESLGSTDELVSVRGANADTQVSLGRGDERRLLQRGRRSADDY